MTRLNSGGGTISAIRDTIDTIIHPIVMSNSIMLVGICSIARWALIVIANVKSKLIRVDIAMSPDEKRTEHRLGEQVQDTVEDGFGVGRDDVSTFAETPGDWVEEPERDGPYTADEECAANVGTEGFGVEAGDPGDVPGYEEEGGAAEDEVSPLLYALRLFLHYRELHY